MFMQNFKSISRSKIALITISALLSIALCASAMASHHAVTEKVISVSGSASASVEPDRVTVRFGVETQQQTSDAALRVNAELMQAVIASVRSAGVEDDEISTSSFNIQPIYDSQQDKNTGRRSQVLTGYRVSNILLVETGNLGLVAPIIDSAVAAGVNRVESVQFSLSRDVMADLKDTLIEQAVLNARAKAHKALAPLGHVITGVRDMSLADFATPSPMYANAPRIEMARSAPTQIFASDQDVRTTVNVTFLIGEVRSADVDHDAD